jgi:glycosyltransferase involved in cell wall biosynthesis
VAKVLFFQNSLRESEKPIFLQTESQSHKYTIQKPGILFANPDGKRHKHMGWWEMIKRFLICIILACRSFFYDVLILDVTTMAFLVAPLLFFRKKPKVIVLHFNVLRRRSGLILWLSRIFFRRINYFIVHSRYDAEYAAKLYSIPSNKIAFWPFIRAMPASGLPPEEYTTGINKPFIMSYGTNARDYETLFEAARATDLPFIVVARKFNVEGFYIPENVKLFYDVPLDECDKLVGSCLFTVFTFDGTEPSCGQISMVTSLMLGKPVICTDCTAVKDYIINGYSGLYVNFRDAEGLRAKMLKLYNDRGLYGTLCAGAKEWAVKNVVPEDFHAHMDKIVTELTAK